MKKPIRITTVPLSLDKLLGRQLSFMSGHFRITAVLADAAELRRTAKKYAVANCHIKMSRLQQSDVWQALPAEYQKALGNV